MPRTVPVEVTQDDLDRGVADDCSRCPVARALSRALGGPWSVTAEIAYPVPPVEGRWVDLPGPARVFVVCYDASAGRGQEPFTFVLAVPWLE